MSDVNDWTGVSAGSTQLLASGQVAIAVGGLPHIALANIPQTTRSLVVILKNDIATGGPVTINSVQVVGGNTNLAWVTQGKVLNDGGGTSAGAGQPFTPVYLPFYGQVDGSATLTISPSAPFTCDYWVLALPDADLLGSALLPLAVINSPFPNVAPANAAPVAVGITSTGVFNQAGVPANPFAVELFDGASNQQGINAHPVRVADVAQNESTGAVVTLGVTAVTIVSAPPAGTVRKVMAVYFDGTTVDNVFQLTINGNAVARGTIPAAAGSEPAYVTGPWYLKSNPLTGVLGSGASRATATWVDEP